MNDKNMKENENIEKAKEWLLDKIKYSDIVESANNTFVLWDKRIMRKKKLAMIDSDIDTDFDLTDADQIFIYEPKNDYLYETKKIKRLLISYENIALCLETQFGLTEESIKEICSPILKNYLGIEEDIDEQAVIYMPWKIKDIKNKI